MKKQSIRNNSTGLARGWLILIIVLSVLVVGSAGYVAGRNKAEEDAKAKYDKQVQTLQTEIDKAKTNVSNGAQQGQQTVDALQAENAQLKSQVQSQQTKITEQDKKIADLEKQLAEANSNNSSQTPQ